MVISNSIDPAKQILLSNGYVIDEEIIRDGKLHRFGFKRKQDQWYVCYENYIIAGDWQGRLPEIRQFINQEEGYKISDREWEEIEKTAYAERVKREAELRENYEWAKLQAYDQWEDELSTQGESEYLDKKKLSPINGIKFGQIENRRGREEKFIAVKVVDNDDEITSIHYMYDCGKKRFFTGGQLRGCYSPLQYRQEVHDDTTIFICEGVATGLSILLAYNDSLVIAALNCGNLKETTKNIIAKYPKNRVIIAGDNDCYNEKYGDKNIGKIKAIEASKAYNVPYVLPEFKDISSKPSDFDDLRQLEGVSEVKRQLEALLIENEEITPIQNESLKEVKKFNINNFLPKELADFVGDVSSRLCVPPDLIAIPLITGLSSLIAGKVTIKPKKNDDFCIFANLWGGLIASPGAKKTPSLKEALSFFSNLERAADKDYETRKEEYEQKDREFKIQKKALDNKYTKLLASEKDISQVLDALNSLQEPEEVFLERYRLNEATTQKITEILRNNSNPSLLLERDELSGFLANLDRKENESDRSYFLEMWNGNASIKSDTIGRGSISVSNAAISIIGTTQPDLVKRYLEKALNSFNDGLLQRFQLLIYPDSIENKYIDSKPNQEAKRNIIKIANFLNDTDFSIYANDFIEKDGKDYPYFSFNEEAQEIYQDWYISNDKKVSWLYKEGKSLMSQHLAKYHKLMPALCLIFHLVKNENEIEKKINKETIEKSILFCDYLETHAQRIYGMSNTEDAYNSVALEFINKIKDKVDKEGEKCVFLKEFTKRIIKRKFNSYQEDSLVKILDILVEHHYLIEKYTPTSFGQREKYSYFLNQHLLDKWQNKN